MRWVCKDDIEECLTEEWRQAAANALEKLVEAEGCEARKAILNKKSSAKIWRDYFVLLNGGLKRKCWYCEAEDIRADKPVDHFRPKNKVDDDVVHEGYWWLAFDWKNYRCACTYCNSRRVSEETEGGKACRFPIVDPAMRAYSPANDYKNEQPDILDPFDPDDWKLLWFDLDGKPEAKPEATEDEQRKVSNTVEIFHLHESRIVRARNRVRLEVNRQIGVLKSAEAAGDLATINDAKGVLRRMVRDTEKLSKAAIVYLRQHRELDVVKDILQLD